MKIINLSDKDLIITNLLDIVIPLWFCIKSKLS